MQLYGEQCKLYAGCVKSVPDLYGSRQAAAEKDQGTEAGCTADREGTQQERISKTGADSPSIWKRADSYDHGDNVRDRDPGERTEIFPCRKYTVRLDQSMEQREVPYCDPAGDPQEKTDLIYRKRKNPQRGDLPYSDRDDEGSVKYMERNEKSGGKSGDRTEKSIST